MEKRSAAAAIVKCLELEQVAVVFGLPGAAICPFYDALSYSSIRHVLVRQEQNAAHMASGYARMSGQPGVCIATSGPGALNLITGVATAFMDSVPLVVITGQVESGLLGRDVFQEADITGSCEPFVKHSYLVKDARELPRIMKEAFHIAKTGRQGPVLIDVPEDIQREKIEFTYPETVDIRSYKPNLTGHPGQIKRVAAALRHAERPLLCVGGGVFSAGAQRELQDLLEHTGLPSVTTMMGLSVISPDFPRYLGMIGMHGEPTANRAMNAADVLLLIGARVGDRAIMSPMGLAQNSTIIHIDVDPAEIGKNIATDIPLVGDAKLILRELAERVENITAPDWTKAYRAQGHPAPAHSAMRRKASDVEHSVKPSALLAALCAALPPDGILVADVGQNQIWSARGYSLKRGRFLTSGGMGTMGYAIPCACGAKIACPARMAVAVCGDGAFQMTGMELATIQGNQLPVKMVVMNNGQLGMVRELQDTKYGGNRVAVALDGNPDFVKLAQAYGIPAERITHNGEISAAVERLLRQDGPALLECIISPDEPTL